MKLIQKIKGWFTHMKNNVVPSITHKKQYDMTYDNLEFIEYRISQWLECPLRKDQITGQNYYRCDHDILKHKRVVEIDSHRKIPLSINNRIVDNLYGLMVDQKVNYLTGKRFIFDTDRDYQELLDEIVDDKFFRTFKRVCEDSLNCGIGWLHVYYENDELRFRAFDPIQILPFWKDEEHTQLDYVVRVYPSTYFDGKKEIDIQKVEIYTPEGVRRYYRKRKDPYHVGYTVPNISPEYGAKYELVKEEKMGYIKIKSDEDELIESWKGHIPVIPFKYNAREIPLIKRCKSLQDAYNNTKSKYQNQMDVDIWSSILIIKNAGATPIEKIRELAVEFGAIKVNDTVDGGKGDVTALTIEHDSESYKLNLEMHKKAMIENCRGFNAKDERLSGGHVNEMNIKSAFADIDLDANGMIAEFKASFKELLWFLNQHLELSNKGSYFDRDVKIIFNKDMIINESEILERLQKCGLILSQETLRSQVPFVDDVEEERKRVLQDQKESLEQDATYQETMAQIHNDISEETNSKVKE